MMEQRLLTLFARTPVHVGAGNSVGAVDSPVMRERHTRIPIIPGSSLKGVLRDIWDEGSEDCLWLFGNEQGETEKDNFRAGALLIGEARVLAFPVRSAKGGFAWITCPLALRRFKRDTGLGDVADADLDSEHCLASKAVTLDDKVVLEEYCLTVDGEPPTGFMADIADDDVWKEIDKRLVVVSDEMFFYFVEHACEVVTRVRINDETGTVEGTALFNQENVPSETLFTCMIGAQDEKKKGGGEKTAGDALDALGKALDGQVIQVGGDETIGLGYCSVKLTGKNGGAA